MTMDKVTEALAFVLENAEFTNAILFAEPLPPDLKPEERAAVQTILRETETSYIALLSECRRAFLQLARTTVLEENWALIGGYEQRSSTMWKSGMVQVPLLLKKTSWLAWVSFGIFTDSEQKTFRLCADLTTQARHFATLENVLQAAGTRMNPIGAAHRIGGRTLAKDDSFQSHAEALANEVTPLAASLYAALKATA
jgi:hypothetical protein